MAINETIRLTNAQTRTLLPLEDRAAGTFTRFLLIEGNSLLSTVFIESLDVGATVKVNYFEDTTGRFASERKDLPSHPLQSVANTDPSKITVTPFHNSPILEVIVAGGDARFSVHATVVSSFATDLDNNLHLDAEDADLTEDKGLPAMCYDETLDKFFFLRCDNGTLPITGTVTLSPVIERVVGGPTLIADTTSTDLITHMPAANKRIQRILMGGDGYGEFTVKINGGTWGIVRNSWNDRTKVLEFGNKLLLTTDTLIVAAENVSVKTGGSCSFEAIVYLTAE